MSSPEEFRQELETFLKNLPEEVLKPTLRVGSVLIGERATNKYMQEGHRQARARVHRGPLRRVSGRLARSLTMARGRIADTGGSPEGIQRIELGKRRARLEKGSKVPYARIHEYGGNIRITGKMRGFFWFKYDQTGDPKWKYMALTDNPYIVIPERAYLRPALDDVIEDIAEDLARRIVEKFPDG